MDSASPEPSIRPSLRRLSLAAAATIGLLAFAVIAGLIASVVLLKQSIAEVERHTRNAAEVSELEGALREYHRLASLLTVTGDPRIAEARGTLVQNLRTDVTDLGQHAMAEDEVRLVAAFAHDLERYLAQRETLDARGLPLVEVLPAVRSTFDGALASVDALGQYHASLLSRDHANVARLTRLMFAVATLAGLFLVVSLSMTVLGIRLLILRPLDEIRGTMKTFERGDTNIRAPEQGLREICDIAQTFNGMAETIHKRRHDLLNFLAAIAHDLRNPLAALKLSSHSLLEGHTVLSREAVARLDRQLDRMARMVGDLLDAIRIESGQLELELEDMDLCNTAREMVDLYGPTSPAHEVVLEAPEHPVEIHADPLRIEQVLSNLLSNAIKYSPGGGRVMVKIEVIDERAELRVEDHGVGIAPADIPHLFVPFRRGTLTKKITPGAGLGLSAVRRIVDAHDGRIDVESKLGKGSTFRIRLPLAPRTHE